MKYGLKETQESPPDDDKNVLSGSSTPEGKVESVVVEVKTTEKESETPDVNIAKTAEKASEPSDVNTLSEADSCNESSAVTEPENNGSQLPINEPINTEPITVTAPEKPEICDNFIVPTLTPIYKESPENYVQQTNVVEQHQVQCETSAMVCDAATPDESVMEVVTNGEETNHHMEVVASVDDESSEVEMVSHPPTPNDVDMFAMVEAQQDNFVKPNVNYNLKNAPIVELSRCSWGTNTQKFLRGCIFSPDGTCILTTVNKDGMHIFELPLSLYENESVSTDRPVDILTNVVHVPEGGSVYDYCWYPFMNSSLPDTCCFLSSRQHEPLQLWDAFDGKLRCTYRGYDAVDEVESALSVCFSIDGSQVIGGYKKTLKIFRTDVPGRDYTSFPLKSPASCIAVNATDGNMIAIGSWNSFVTLHDVRSAKLTMTDKLVKHTGGVTLMKFSSDGNRLITGARKDNKLIGWDLRNVTVPLFNLSRTVATNQRIYFDISSSDQWLVSGDTDGILHVFDVEYGTKNGKFPDYQYKLHHDSCNGVSLHPTRPIFATSSGQHHFIDTEEGVALRSAETQENSLIFWWCGSSDCE
ncbi:telomerase Cajal body protein 1 homolog [Bradysia coprophila]|uniref:telomerase Cajal body protein 1 homolog n=1 Tax=Bradysia coprophila TaxID=38358 RepID=UPI00187DC798|nr:telomerase Cajal body protein 1 homolog [Bradysia coprophila]